MKPKAFFIIMSIIKMNFDTEIAKLVGTDAAIVYSNIEYWVEHNKLNNKHFYDDNYWTFNSIEAFKKLFDYLSISQIKTCIQKLEKNNLIIVGNYNKLGYDRTKWYSIPINATIGEKSQMDLSEIANPLAENDQPIPYYKTDTINNKIDFVVLMDFFNSTFKRNCRVFPKKAKKQFEERLKEGYDKKDIKNVIINVKQSDWHTKLNYSAVSLEFLSRSKTFELYSQIIPKKEQQVGHINH